MTESYGVHRTAYNVGGGINLGFQLDFSMVEVGSQIT